jgi:hypothetical protein
MLIEISLSISRGCVSVPIRSCTGSVLTANALSSQLVRLRSLSLWKVVSVVISSQLDMNPLSHAGARCRPLVVVVVYLHSSVALLLWVCFVLPFYRSSWFYSFFPVQSAESVDNSHLPLLILSAHHPVVAVCRLFCSPSRDQSLRSSRPTRLSSVGLCSTPSRHSAVVCVPVPE